MRNCYARRTKRGAFVALSIFKVSDLGSDIELCTKHNRPRSITFFLTPACTFVDSLLTHHHRDAQSHRPYAVMAVATFTRRSHILRSRSAVASFSLKTISIWKADRRSEYFNGIYEAADCTQRLRSLHCDWQQDQMGRPLKSER